MMRLSPLRFTRPGDFGDIRGKPAGRTVSMKIQSGHFSCPDCFRIILSSKNRKLSTESSQENRLSDERGNGLVQT